MNSEFFDSPSLHCRTVRSRDADASHDLSRAALHVLERDKPALRFFPREQQRLPFERAVSGEALENLIFCALHPEDGIDRAVQQLIAAPDFIRDAERGKYSLSWPRAA